MLGPGCLLDNWRKEGDQWGQCPLLRTHPRLCPGLPKDQLCKLSLRLCRLLMSPYRTFEILIPNGLYNLRPPMCYMQLLLLFSSLLLVFFPKKIPSQSLVQNPSPLLALILFFFYTPHVPLPSSHFNPASLLLCVLLQECAWCWVA